MFFIIKIQWGDPKTWNGGKLILKGGVAMIESHISKTGRHGIRINDNTERPQQSLGSST